MEALNQLKREVSTLIIYYLDKSAPHVCYRWIGCFVLVSLYVLRVYYTGCIILTFCLGIIISMMFMDFLSPRVDPGRQRSDCPVLPIMASDESGPFIRRLPEFHFWFNVTKSLCLALVFSFIPIFKARLGWHIYLFSWFLFTGGCVVMRIGHMIKYKYNPFIIRCQGYKEKKGAAGG